MGAVPTNNPADLFIALYDALGDGPFRSQEVRQWDRNNWVSECAERVHDEVVSSGVASPEVMDEILSRGPIGTFAVLKGLDRALEHVDVRRSSENAVGQLNHLLSDYLDTGRLNSHVKDGLLLFRLAWAGRPLTLPDRAQYFGLVRVPPKTLCDVDFSMVKTNGNCRSIPPLLGIPTIVES